MPSNHRDKLALGIGVAVDVPLGRLDRPVASEQLDVAQRATCPCTSRAARVMNVRRPECDEQPCRPMCRNARLNQTTMLSGLMATADARIE